MKITRCSTHQVIAASPRWQTASGALVAGEVQRIKIPTAKPNDMPTITQYIQNFSSEQLHGWHGSNIVFNLYFNSHHETQVALNTFCNVLPASAFASNTEAGSPVPTARPGTIPSITITQGAAGGAVIGGIGGAAVAALLQGLKSATDASGNPILITLGTVLAGIAVGAAGGAVFAKTTEYSLSIGKTGVSLAAGTQRL